MSDECVRFIVSKEKLPALYPTHLHDSKFWEALGRTVATFGFLEEVLAKAIFSFTATTHYAEQEIDAAYKKWIPQLERALSDPLGNLINTYSSVVRNNQSATIQNLDDLICDLLNASKIRNVLCHGSWKEPMENGASIPFFINRQNEIFETPLSEIELYQIQKHTVELACAVINTVTHMGWQFPSTNGPGLPIFGKV